MSVNKVILLGHLGKDPELRQTANKNAVCTFSIATNERRKDANGNWVDHTEWHNIIVFGKTAENCSKFLKKGRQAFVDGRIQTRKWQDKEGRDRYTTEIVANTVQFIGGGKGEGMTSSDGGMGAPSDDMGMSHGGGGAPSAAATEVTIDDDDIPF
jgi:single-strand DNA-binding protein